jgi:hypothetical protein
MKRIILLICLLQCIHNTAKAQTFLLLDRRWDKEAVFTDSVTRQILSDGWYPIYQEDLDTLIVLVDRLKNLKNDGLKRKFYYSEDFRATHLKFVIENIKRTYGDGYEINLISSGPFGENTVKLSDSRELLDVNQKTIRAFLAYLKRTQKQLPKLKTK